MEIKDILELLKTKNYSQAKKGIREMLDGRLLITIDEECACVDGEDDYEDDYEDEELDDDDWYPIEYADDDEEEQEGYVYDYIQDDEISERRRIKFRVTSKGKKLRKVKCGRGYKISPDKKRCIKIVGSAAMNMRKGKRKMVRTKKAKGGAYLKRSIRKRGKALRRRKSMGIKAGR